MFLESQYFVDETFNSITLEIYVKELNHFKKKNYLNRLLLQNSNNLVENDKKSSIDESLSYIDDGVRRHHPTTLKLLENEEY